MGVDPIGLPGSARAPSICLRVLRPSGRVTSLSFSPASFRSALRCWSLPRVSRTHFVLTLREIRRVVARAQSKRFPCVAGRVRTSMAATDRQADQVAPDPNDSIKPESPTDLTRPSVLYVLRTTAREFARDQCTDQAAALTYYAVLSMFPGLVVMVSLLGVLGQGKRTTDAVLQIVGELGPPSVVDTLRGPVQQVVDSPSTGFALIVGVIAGLWSASGYIGAFGRALNRIYEIPEGRPFWKLRPLQLLLTLAGLIMAGAVACMLAVSGPVAKAIGDAIGVGHAALLVWNTARWPVILVLVILAVAILYHATPNVRQPKFRWISVGAAVAIVVWIVASLLFGLYVSNFGKYNKTYGTLAGVIVFLLWLWITNLALLFGAELDSELERARELQAGMPAERDLQLPPRDTRVSDKRRDKDERALQRAKRLRQSRGREDESR